jgi:hypothetical protein
MAKLLVLELMRLPDEMEDSEATPVRERKKLSPNARLSAYGGIWVIAVIAGIWGLTFFGDSGHGQKCESHRRDLLASKNQAQAQKQNLEKRVQTIIGEYTRDFARCRGEAQTLVAEYRNLPSERQRRILHSDRGLRNFS